jgi:putative AlgH/UPF0301 family transcriptional regulator
MTSVKWLEEEMLKPNLSMKDILEKAKEMEKQQQYEFAIGFAEWKEVNQIDHLKSTIQELLEIYKKEKGL